MGTAMNIRQTLTATAGALVALTLAAGTGARADTILNYTFDPGATFDLGGGNVYAATGTFSYDVTTGMVTAVAYDAIQTGTGPTGPFDFTAAVTTSSTDVTFINDGDGDQDEYFFAQSLALGGTDTITGAAYDGGVITGSGSVSAGVPEPATWAMMLVGFGGLGVAMRSRRRLAVAAA